MEWLRGKCIGKGSFGTVHVAVDRTTGRAFAVKSVDAKGAPPAAAAACLESEIRILKRLSSPYVVAYLGDDATGASRNLHMELVPGGSAAEAAAAAGGLGERAARGVLRRVAAALHYLHAVAGVVHGDVKGRNVLVGGNDGEYGGAKLADFGAARLVSDAAAPRGPRGTPAWMAPEVARGGAPTPASDVWSLGCTAVELLTGKRPWSELGGAFEVGGLLLLIGFGGKRPELPACQSDSCRDFLDKCLRLDTGERWSCEQLLRHPFLSADPFDACEPSPSPSPRAVLDWASASASDSDSEASSDGPEADSEHEVMARAKGRVAELASNGPRASWGREWEGGPTWAADTWAPRPSPEMPTNAPPPSNASAGNGNAGGPDVSDGGRDGVLVVDAGAGFCRVRGRSCCNSHCAYYKYGLAVVGLGWPPLSVVSVLVSCALFSYLIQSKFVFKQAAGELICVRFWLMFPSLVLTCDAAADWVSRPRLVGQRGVWCGWLVARSPVLPCRIREAVSATHRSSVWDSVCETWVPVLMLWHIRLGTAPSEIAHAMAERYGAVTSHESEPSDPKRTA